MTDAWCPILEEDMKTPNYAQVGVSRLKQATGALIIHMTAQATMRHPTCKKLTESHRLDATSWPLSDERLDLREAGSGDQLAFPPLLPVWQVFACCEAGRNGAESVRRPDPCFDPRAGSAAALGGVDRSFLFVSRAYMTGCCLAAEGRLWGAYGLLSGSPPPSKRSFGF